MTKEIPSEVQLRYIKHPFFCPYCESSQIATITPAEVEHDFATQVVMCVDCDNKWLDVYELCGVEPYMFGPDATEPF